MSQATPEEALGAAPRRGLARTFRAFGYRDFRLLWAGSFTSSAGTWMQAVAQNWLILTMTGSAFLLGLNAFLGEVPFLLFSLLGGVLADRVDRRRILLASQVVQLSSAFLLAGLILAGSVQVWMILVLSFVVGLAQSFGGPAYQALVPTLVVMVAFAISRHALLSYVLLALAGAALMIVFAMFMTLVQSYAKDHLRGRVVSVYSPAFRGAIPLGNLAAGFAATLVSPPAVLIADGALLAGLAAVVLARRRPGGVTTL